MNKIIKALLVIICVFLLGACYKSVAYAPVAIQTCDLNLQLFIDQEPSLDRTISGYVEFGSDTWSSFKLDFVEENGLSHPSSFSFDGQAIHFILDTEDGRIFATGIMESNLATCSGNGGGTLSGPLIGDLGDWRGEWVATVIPAPPIQPNTNNPPSLSSMLFCLYLPIIVVGLFLVIFLFRLFAPYKLLAPFKKTRSSKHQTSNSASALRRTNQGTRSKLGKEEQPLAEYLATYTADDKFFDLSFQIEKASRYLGEYGIVVARVLDAKPSQATALEIWLFDTQGAQTISKILASNFCFSQGNLRNELEQIGQVVLIQAGETTTLETKEIKAEAKVLQVEYESSSPDPQSAFKKVVIQIEVWANAG